MGTHFFITRSKHEWLPFGSQNFGGYACVWSCLVKPVDRTSMAWQSTVVEEGKRMKSTPFIIGSQGFYSEKTFWLLGYSSEFNFAPLSHWLKVDMFLFLSTALPTWPFKEYPLLIRQGKLVRKQGKEFYTFCCIWKKLWHISHPNGCQHSYYS